MANDNLLTIVMTQKEGDGILSRLTLEYPDMDNATCNEANLGFVQALLDKARQFAWEKAGGQNVPPGLAKK